MLVGECLCAVTRKPKINECIERITTETNLFANVLFILVVYSIVFDYWLYLYIAKSLVMTNIAIVMTNMTNKYNNLDCTEKIINMHIAI